MREIKFRQYMGNGEWDYWGLVDGGFTWPMLGEGCKPNCQFTGLHDKNGKEIYEGDVIAEKIYVSPEMSSQRVDKGTDISAVESVAAIHQQIGAQISLTLDEEMDTYLAGGFFEVLGNIHENPELLK